MRTFYDSTTTNDLPRTAPNALRYTDGAYADTEANVRRRCPRAKTVIGATVNGSTPAPMIDCERGNVLPPRAAQLARAYLDATGKPRIIYFPLSWHAQVAAECRALGLVPGKTVLFFAARYGKDDTIPPGFVGVQYLSPDGPVGARPPGHYDVSVVVDYIVGIDPKPPLAHLRHGKRRNARALNRELGRRLQPVTDPRDRALLARLAATLGRVLGGGK